MYDGDYTICLGVLKTTETVYHISLEFDYGSELIISDYDMLKENEEYIKWITDNEGKVSCPNGESKIEYRKELQKREKKLSIKLLTKKQEMY